MATLYYFANKLSYMVVGTGNKTELMVGYFTKYGDGGVDILPLGHLYKRQVRALAAELGVPDPIITKPPSAGLWSGQTDEQEMGITYEELDATLEAIESGETENVSPGVLEKVTGMIARSAHKRTLAPIFDADR
jgi:NAD+ synthase